MARALTMGRLWWENFKRTMRIIGDFQARIILTIMYAVLVLPMGLLLRPFLDPLHLRRPPQPASYWLDREPLDDTLEGARLQS
ncbi:MAG: hypothetical protein HZY76_18585 [Anaerolineae bacterium]|nr:MAG: hypothetical protein HZY76_18585 [Anaerolineae bacterium]